MTTRTSGGRGPVKGKPTGGRAAGARPDTAKPVVRQRVTAASSVKAGGLKATATKSAGPKTTGPKRPAPGRPTRGGPPRPPRGRTAPARIPDPPNPDVRVRWVVVVIAVLLGVFSLQLIRLQLVDPGQMRAEVKDSLGVSNTLYAHRGDILDINGKILAQSVDRVTVIADPTLVPCYKIRRCTSGLRATPAREAGVPAAAQDLAPLLKVSVSDLRERLSQPKDLAADAALRRYSIVAKDVEPKVWEKIADLGIPGISPESATRRLYPDKEYGASVVGRFSATGTTIGIEGSRNDTLAGRDGEVSFQRSADGLPIAGGLIQKTPVQEGSSVRLTLDRDLQYRLQSALAAQVAKSKAESATGVVMDPRTGDVLALASVPTFDPNDMGASDPEDRGNRALIDGFEPGSTQKVITVAAAMEEGLVTPATQFSVDWTIKRSDRTFHDSHKHGREQLTTAGILAQSSNVGTIMIGEKLPKQTFYDYMHSFGLGQPTGIGLRESEGILAPVNEWSGSQHYTMMFGQGLAVTAIQSASVFATLANDGVRVRPRLVAGVIDPQGRETAEPPSQERRVVSAKTARLTRLMLENVVTDEGTAARAGIPGYRVAGKTGTAQIAGRGGYLKNEFVASFVGMAPAEDPELVVAIFVQKPKGDYYGGTVAGPVFKAVMQSALAARKIAPRPGEAPDVPVTWP